MENFQFDFERLKVYQKVLDLTDLIFDIYKKMNQDYKIAIGSNLIRAILSVSNNLAEGNDKESVKERKRYFGISCDSMRECVSVFNVLKRQNLIDISTYQDLRFRARGITSMIKGLISGS